jgi:hypothetical protein
VYRRRGLHAKETIVKEKRFFVGLLALVFALALTGCDGEWITSAIGYTFRFRVYNNSSAIITKVDFINGSNRNGFVLRSPSGIRLTNGELSDEYRVSGFTEEYGTNERFCGVIVTYADGTDSFAYWHSGHESKILVTATDDYWSGRKLAFSSGNW